MGFTLCVPSNERKRTFCSNLSFKATASISSHVPSWPNEKPRCFWDCGEHHRGSLPASPHTLIKHQQPFPICSSPYGRQCRGLDVEFPLNDWSSWCGVTQITGLDFLSVSKTYPVLKAAYDAWLLPGFLTILCCCCLVSGFCLGFVGAGLLYFSVWKDGLYSNYSKSLFLYR